MHILIGEFHLETWAVILPLIFMALDVVSGLLKAAKSGTVSSSVMRQGLFAKSGSILVLGLAALVDFTVSKIDVGFINGAITATYAVYIVAMETTSIIENACEINPDLKKAKLLQIFANSNDKESATDES